MKKILLLSLFALIINSNISAQNSGVYVSNNMGKRVVSADTLGVTRTIRKAGWVLNPGIGIGGDDGAIFDMMINANYRFNPIFEAGFSTAAYITPDLYNQFTMSIYGNAKVYILNREWSPYVHLAMGYAGSGFSMVSGSGVQYKNLNAELFLTILNKLYYDRRGYYYNHTYYSTLEEEIFTYVGVRFIYTLPIVMPWE